MVETVALSACLRMLPEYEREVLMPHLQLIHVQSGEELSSEPHLFWFPIDVPIALMECDEEMDLTFANRGEVLAVAQQLRSSGIRSKYIARGNGSAYRLDVRGVSASRLPTFLERVDDMNAMLLGRAFKTVMFAYTRTVAQRVARYLLQFNTKIVSSSQQQIADALCLRRETVTEAFNEFKTKGWITHWRIHIEIINPEALGELVDNDERRAHYRQTKEKRYGSTKATGR